MEKADFFTKILGITNPEILQKFCDAAKTREFKKNEFLLRRGKFEKNLFFLVDGISRGFTENEEGVEVTECFIYRYGQPAVGSYRLDTPLDVSIVAETNSTYIQISKYQIQELMKRYPILACIYNQLLISEMEEQQNIRHVCTLKAKERYEWFLREYDGLIDLVKHRHVASFLNITPVTLSRLRKEKKQKDETLNLC